MSLQPEKFEKSTSRKDNYQNQHERFYQRKKAKNNGVVAIKALSNKLVRASYYVMRDQVAFNSRMLFA